MKRKMMLLLMVLAIGGVSVSCFKKKPKEEPKKQVEQPAAPAQQPAELNLNNGITNLTPEEQKFLTDNNTDPLKVSEAIKKAEEGDKNAIMSLAQLYYGFKDNEKAKKYLQLGVAKNYPEAIYNLALIYQEEGNKVEADKLLAMLPKENQQQMTNQLGGGAAALNGQQGAPNIPAAAVQAYNNGVNHLRAKKLNEAKAEFEKAYNQGAKDVDVQIGLINKEQKNYPEAIKWFKRAADRGVQGAGFEVGAMLFDSGKQVEARPYLMKEYNAGNKQLARFIALTYHKENNIQEALKWYDIAAKNGDKQAQEIMAQARAAGQQQQAAAAARAAQQRQQIQVPRNNSRAIAPATTPVTSGKATTNSGNKNTNRGLILGGNRNDIVEETIKQNENSSNSGKSSGNNLKIDTSKFNNNETNKKEETKEPETKPTTTNNNSGNKPVEIKVEPTKPETKTTEKKPEVKVEPKKETKSVDDIMKDKVLEFNE